MNALGGDRWHIRVWMRVEAFGNLARGPNSPVGLWTLKSNRVHLDLRFEVRSLQREAMRGVEPCREWMLPVFVRAAERESTRGSPALGDRFQGTTRDDCPA